MTTTVPAAMLSADTATQAELDAAIAAEVSARNEAITAGNVKLSGDVVQVVNTQTGAVATGTTTIPLDDTIPQNTEGDQYMTLSITPTSASNYLRVDVKANISAAPGGTGNLIAALFRDSGADAVCAQVRFLAGNGFHPAWAFTYYVAAGSTSATTFKLRAGCTSAGTTTFNGASGTRQLGGVMLSSITITEIKA